MLNAYTLLALWRPTRGEIKEKQQAKREFRQALAENKQAALLESERPDVFSAKVGNLKPGEHATVRLSYVAEIAMDQGVTRFTLPTVVAPPYVPRAKLATALDGSKEKLPSAVRFLDRAPLVCRS